VSQIGAILLKADSQCEIVEEESASELVRSLQDRLGAGVKKHLRIWGTGVISKNVVLKATVSGACNPQKSILGTWRANPK
jgi:hypothetical protein